MHRESWLVVGLLLAGGAGCGEEDPGTVQVGGRAPDAGRPSGDGDGDIDQQSSGDGDGDGQPSGDGDTDGQLPGDGDTDGEPSGDGDDPTPEPISQSEASLYPFDHEKVYVFGDLPVMTDLVDFQVTRGGIMTLDDPSRAIVGFENTGVVLGDASGAVIRASDERLLYYANTTAGQGADEIRTFDPETIMMAGERYPDTPESNDAARRTVCGPRGLYLPPDSDEPYYLCTETEGSTIHHVSSRDVIEVPQGMTVAQAGAGGRFLLHSFSGHGPQILHRDTGEVRGAGPVRGRIMHARAHGDGFWLVTADDFDYQRWFVHDGGAELEGQYQSPEPLPYPTGCVLDGVGDAYCSYDAGVIRLSMTEYEIVISREIDTVLDNVEWRLFTGVTPNR
ncbi:MAG: hypothetical protein OXR73_01290 [Myxococcales bacterium]|nr:hypothetical protein [Myxococcales bacterium]